MSKESAHNAGDTGDASMSPALGKSPGGGCGNPLQYSYLETPMNRGAWWVTKSPKGSKWGYGRDMVILHGFWKQTNWTSTEHIIVQQKKKWGKEREDVQKHILGNKEQTLKWKQKIPKSF